jgi:2-polyprenyl-3-methyl-5-hydroxy-6-metoxy-1,4-benzoquinol methylase
MLRRFFFEVQYLSGKPPWDSNITPPEVIDFVASPAAGGRALDLGCGTGTNSIYLAQRGFAVVGVDFSVKAIAAARAKARNANVAVEFHIADVTRLEFLREPFDLMLDIGCLHALDAVARARYAEHLARLTRRNATLMLYAFSPRPDAAPRHWLPLRNVGITLEQVQQVFTADFVLERVEHGADRGDRASAWYWFRKK